MYSKKCNFTDFETELLYSLLEKFKTIIECKKTSVFFNNKKDEAWKNLADEFNAVKGVSKRNAKQLRDKYKNMKKISKKKKENDVIELFTVDYLEPTPDEKIYPLDVIMQPPSKFDCDTDCDNTVKIVHVESVPSETASFVPEYNGNAVAEDVEMSAEIPAVSSSTPTSSEVRDSLNNDFTLRRKASIKTSDALVEETIARRDAALAEKVLKEKELECKEAEHKQNMCNAMKLHEMEIKVLQAKLKFYEEKTKRIRNLSD